MPKGIPKTHPENQIGQARSLSPDELERRQKIQVKMMTSTKTSLKAMADMLGITVPTLRKNFAKELRSGHDYVYAQISQKIVATAIGGDVRSMLAWMRQFGGWQEITRREVTGKDGEPISFRNLDAAALSGVIEALSQKGNAGRGPGRNGAAIDIDGAVDLDAISGPTDESAGE